MAGANDAAIGDKDGDARCGRTLVGVGDVGSDEMAGAAGIGDGEITGRGVGDKGWSRSSGASANVTTGSLDHLPGGLGASTWFVHASVATHGAGRGGGVLMAGGFGFAGEAVVVAVADASMGPAPGAFAKGGNGQGARGRGGEAVAVTVGGGGGSNSGGGGGSNSSGDGSGGGFSSGSGSDEVALVGAVVATGVGGGDLSAVFVSGIEVSVEGGKGLVGSRGSAPFTAGGFKEASGGNDGVAGTDDSGLSDGIKASNREGNGFLEASEHSLNGELSRPGFVEGAEVGFKFVGGDGAIGCPEMV